MAAILDFASTPGVSDSRLGIPRESKDYKLVYICAKFCSFGRICPKISLTALDSKLIITLLFTHIWRTISVPYISIKTAYDQYFGKLYCMTSHIIMSVIDQGTAMRSTIPVNSWRKYGELNITNLVRWMELNLNRIMSPEDIYSMLQ